PLERDAYVVRDSGRDGRFSLPPQDGPYSVVVLHDRGFAAIGVGPGAPPSAITLRPWGRVEGTLRIGSRPGAKQAVSLERDQPAGPPAPGVAVHNTAETDVQGRFVFERVMPGAVRLEHLVEGSNTARPGAR